MTYSYKPLIPLVVMNSTCFHWVSLCKLRIWNLLEGKRLALVHVQYTLCYMYFNTLKYALFYGAKWLFLTCKRSYSSCKARQMLSNPWRQVSLSDPISLMNNTSAWWLHPIANVLHFMCYKFGFVLKCYQ